jgi:hypothetical protein
VEDVDVRLADAEGQGAVGEPRPPGEPRGLVGVEQRRLPHAEPPVLAGGAVESAGDDGVDQEPDEARQDDAHRQARRTPPAVRREPGRQLGGPFAQVPGENEAGREREEVRVPERLEGEIAEHDGQEQPEKSSAGAERQRRGQDAQERGCTGEARRAGSRDLAP